MKIETLPGKYRNALNIPFNALYIEILRGKNINAGIEEGDYNFWNSERIKGAFNWGRGTIKNFEEYAADNRYNCKIYKI